MHTFLLYSSGTMKLVTIVMLCCVFAPFSAMPNDTNSRMRSNSHSRNNRTRHTPSPTLDEGEHQFLYDGNSTLAISNSISSRSLGMLMLDDLNVRNVGMTLLEDTSSSYECVQDHKMYRISTNLFDTPSHLDRMDQKLLPLDGKAWHLPDGGEGVTVFVLDTGLRQSHLEFRQRNGTCDRSRVSCGLDTTLGEKGLGWNCVDEDGHGTAVAALIGGRTLGVAKAVRIVSVKLSWGGRRSSIDGLNYVLSQKRANPSTPMVVNLSWGFPRFYSLFSWQEDWIIRKLVEANVTVVVAAGNDGRNACSHSPAQVGSTIVVGFSDPNDDTFSPYSNHGPCVDIIAPGVNILSARSGSDYSYRTASGSSFAAPLVAGTAALYLQQHPTWTPAQVWAAMARDAVRDVIQDIRGSRTPSLLLHYGPRTAVKEEKECPLIAKSISADKTAARGLWPLAVYTQWWTLYMRDVPPQPAERGNCQN